MIWKRGLLTALAFALSAAPGWAQAPRVHALVGARVVVGPGRTLPQATVVIRDGLVVAVGSNVAAPPDARIWDLAGKTLYPGLIDLWVPREWKQAKTDDAEPARTTNPQVNPDRDVLEQLRDDEQWRALRRAGFTTVLVVPQGGIFRGRGAVVDLGDDPRAGVIRPDAVQAVSIAGQGWGSGYPGSLMGAVALVRQTFLDSRWQRLALAAYAADPAQSRPPYDLALAALDAAAHGEQTVVFETKDALAELRDARLAEELGLRAWLVGSGREYERLGELARRPLPLVLPLDFPERPKVGEEGDDLSVSLEELRAWDEAPTNPVRLLDAKIPFALTSYRQKTPDAFWKQLTRAIEAGLPAERALAALTVVPAEFLGLSGRAGSLEAGKLANLLVVDGDLLVESPKIETVWVDGDPYPVEPQGTGKTRGREARR